MIIKIVLMAVLMGLFPATANSIPADNFVDRSKCFTGGDLFICANNVEDGIYTVAVLNPIKSAFPTTLLVSCNGKPEADAFGIMPPIMPSDFLESFCSYVEGVPNTRETEQFI